MKTREGINKETLKVLLLELIKEDAEFRRDIAIFLSREELVTKSYLDESLRKLAEQFDDKLLKLANEFREGMRIMREEMSREFTEKMLALREEMREEMKMMREELREEMRIMREEMSREFTEKMLALREEMREEMKMMREEMSREFTEKMLVLREEMREEMKMMREELREEMRIMREEMSREFTEKMLVLREEMREEMKMMREEMSREFTEKMLALREEIREDMRIMREEFQRDMKVLSDSFDAKLNELRKSIEFRLSIIGNRWGESAEKAFREGMKSIIEKEFGWKVTKWKYDGIIPEIHPKRDKYEVDLVLSDGEVILIEIKGSANEADVLKFYDNIRAYEYINNVRAKRKVMIVAFAFPDGIVEAKKYDIEIITTQTLPDIPSEFLI